MVILVPKGTSGKESEMSDRAIRELELCGLFEKDSIYDGMIGEAVKELFEVFAKQDHSGNSAYLVSQIFYDLVRGKTLTPLRGTPEEWRDISLMSGGPWFQNKRCSAIFAKDDHGTDANYIYGIVFKDKNGFSFNCSQSHVPITFPCYVPETITIEEGTPEAEPYKDVFVWEE
jgi:hypothetical protein